MNIINFKENNIKESKPNLVVTFDKFNNPLSYYKDNAWDFSKYIIRKSSGGYCIHFNQQFSNGDYLQDQPLIINALKDVLFKISCSGVKFNTLKNNFFDLFGFFDYFYTQLKIKDINTLTEKNLEDYVNYLIDKKLSYNTIRARLFTIKNSLFKYRKELEFSIDFEPFKSINISKKIKNNSNVKQHFQTDIIPDNKWQEIINVAHNYIQQYNLNYSNELFISNKYKHMLSLKHNNLRDYYRSFKLNSCPYLNRSQHVKFIKNVQISCAIIMQAFTGMRLSELQSIKHDCIIHETLTLNNNEEINILKIKGKTYKYVEKDSFGLEAGKDVSWICPDIVKHAVDTLNKINEDAFYSFEKIGIKKEDVNIFIKFQPFGHKNIIFNVNDYYNSFIKEHNIELDFELGSHSFRRTFARFLARSIINIPIEVIKEQFKHYSKHITFYYMKEDQKADIEFSELINEYLDNKQNDSSKLLFEEIKNSLDNAILTVSNIEDLELYISGRKLNIVNEFMSSIDEKPEILTPIGCLTCNGNVIIPKLHLSYWEDLLVLYDEMIELEPNSFWHNKERNMIEKVVNDLRQNKAYITGEKNGN